MIYTIYHIPGVKIGCTTEYPKRVYDQGYTESEILEEHQDLETASKREQELQKEYNYKIDNCSYKVARENRLKGSIAERTPEVRKMLAERRRGKVVSEETKKKISETLTGRKLTFSDTHRERLSEVQKGKTLSESHKEALKAAWLKRRLNK